MEAVNIITIEDPVEFDIAGITQVQVNDKTGTTFSSALRSALRQDPDIISIGEIRDAQTADIAMRAAVTGHLVLSTVHANDAISTLDRLTDIGVPGYMQSSAMRGIVSQRLVRRICPACKKPYTPTDEELRMLGYKPGELGPNPVFYHGQGCPECFGSGYRGRTVVAEVLRLSSAVRDALRDEDRDRVVAAIENTDFQPIEVNARELVLSGTTTVDEIVRAVYVAD